MIQNTISHYRILEKLGSGGMGDVYKAEDTKLRRTVALKFLPPELTRDKEAQQRFVQEARAASALDHPNIGTIHEIEETDGHAFIAMACYEGETLKDKIERGPLAVDDAIQTALQIARGLAKAHSRDIVHRDIKPANILITEDEQIKIIDFGLAKLAGGGPLTKPGTSMGTVAYMSPEQAQGAPVDHRTDIWALGAVLYEMLAGAPPFGGEYEQAVMYAIMNEEPEFIAKVRSEISGQIEQILEKALAKSPDRRFQTMEQMLEALEGAAEELKEGRPGRTPLLRLGRKQRRTVHRIFAVGLVAIIASGVYLWRSQVPETRAVSIALLPLASFTPDANQDWFTDGMTDVLITDLARIGGLRVISRATVMRYRGTEKAPPEIGRELGVAYLIEGSVVKMGNRIKVSARLIDAPGDEYVWAQAYERDFHDILALQGELAQAIAGQVQVKLTPQEETRLASSHPVDPEAYELYLKGRHHSNKGKSDDIEKAVDYYYRALERDPDFGPAYTGLVESYLLQGFGTLSPEEASTRFLEHAEKAIELDEALGGDHHLLAMVTLFRDWDWSGAEDELKRALELNPNSSSAYDSYCQLLWAMGRTEESVAAGERAVELDPLSHFANCDLAWAYYFDGRHDDATEHVRRTIELFGPECPWHSELRIRLMLEQAGDLKEAYERATAELERRIEAVAEADLRTMILFGSTCALSGRRDQALKVIQELQERAARKFVDPSHLATIYIALGDEDEAFRLLEQAYAQRSFVLLYGIGSAPWYDPLRDDPRFQNLLQGMNLSGLSG